jgi:HEAT repeat protein
VEEPPFPLEAVRQVLRSGDGPARRAALARLANAAEEPWQWHEPPALADLLPDLVPLLEAKAEPAVRGAAVRALVRMPVPPQDLARALLPLAQEKDVELRRAVAANLGPLVVQAARHADRDGGDKNDVTPGDQARADAIRAVAPLAALGLADADGEVRRHALGAVKTAGAALQQAQRYNQEEGVAKLGKVTRPAAEALAPLVPAVTRLAEGPTLLPALETLETLADLTAAIPLQNYGERAVRRIPSPLAGALRPAFLPSLPLLGRLTANDEVRIRLAALYVLEGLETEAALAIAALARAARDANPFVRWAAARALGRLAPKEAATAVQALTPLLGDTNADVRITAVAALERFGPEARPALGELAKAARAGDVETRWRALQTLGALGPGAVAETRPALLAALNDAAPEVRRAAARTLPRLGPLDAASREALARATEDADERVREEASRVLLGEK